MKNKLKLLLLGVICLLSFIISQTNALTFYGGQNSVNILSSYNGKTLYDPGNGYLSCIIDSYKDSANFDKNLSCSEGSYYMYSPAFISLLVVDGYIGVSQGNYLARGQIEGSRDIFSLLKLRDGEKTIYSKITMKNLQNKMLNVKSARGENVYDQAFINGLGFVLVLPEREQLRGATVIANSYILDGYVLYAAEGVSYMLDTYENKLYIYNNNFYTYQMQQEGALGIFPKLWNLVPDFVYDINWGIGSDDKIYYTYSDYKTFEKTNRREGTKSDLAELRENLKKSIVILNQEHAEIFLGQTPESLGIGSGKPSTDNQTNTNQSNGVEEKKACVDYYTKMKSFTAISASCRGEAKEGQEKFEYWENILFGSYEQYNTRDKLRYWNCYNFGIIKEKWIKSFGQERFTKFQADRETKYLFSKPEDVDINAMCSHIILTPAEKLQEAKNNQPRYDKFFRSLGFLGAGSGVPLGVDGSGNALYQGDFQEELKSLQPYYWQCQGYDKYGLTKITQTEDQKIKACNLYNRYKNKLLEKWKGVELEYTNDSTAEGQVTMQEQRLGKGNGMLESVSSGVSNTLSEGGEVLLKVVKDPFNSGYNALVPLKCSSSPHLEFMNFFLYGLFTIFIFILFRML